MAANEEIRFDPDTGTLHGVSVLPVPELIARAKEKGYRFRPGDYWFGREDCGCALGVNAKLVDPDFDNGCSVEPVLNPDDNLTTWRAHSGVMGGFDVWSTWSQTPGALYGRAVREAAIAAKLWHTDPKPEPAVA